MENKNTENKSELGEAFSFFLSETGIRCSMRVLFQWSPFPQKIVIRFGKS